MVLTYDLKSGKSSLKTSLKMKAIKKKKISAPKYKDRLLRTSKYFLPA